MRHPKIIYLLKFKKLKYLIRNYDLVKTSIKLIMIHRINKFLCTLSKYTKKVYDPLWIHIECINDCNLNCIYCGHPNNAASKMSLESFKYLVDSLPKLKHVDLTPYGEPFLNPQFLDMVEYLRRRNIGVSFDDNFTLLSERDINALIKLEVDTISISLDAANKETYIKLRGKDYFDRIVDNIDLFQELKAKENRQKPNLIMNSTITRFNYKETLDFIELARSLDIRAVVIGKVLWANNKLSMKDDELKSFVTIKKEAIKLAIKYNIFVAFIHFDGKKNTIKSCPKIRGAGGGWVTFDGDYYPCCLMFQKRDRETIKPHIFINLFEKKFKDLENSERYKQFYREVEGNKMPFLCKKCELFYGR